MDKLDMESKKIVTSNIDKIKELFPNVIIEDNGKEVINFDTLKQELSEVIVDDKKESTNLHGQERRRLLLMPILLLIKL